MHFSAPGRPTASSSIVLPRANQSEPASNTWCFPGRQYRSVVTTAGIVTFGGVNVVATLGGVEVGVPVAFGGLAVHAVACSTPSDNISQLMRFPCRTAKRTTNIHASNRSRVCTRASRPTAASPASKPRWAGLCRFVSTTTTRAQDPDITFALTFRGHVCQDGVTKYWWAGSSVPETTQRLRRQGRECPTQ